MKRGDNSDTKNDNNSFKRPKNRFGRTEKREISRFNKRDTYNQKKEHHQNQINDSIKKDDDTSGNDSDSDSGNDGEGVGTIASKRSQMGESNLAYSALVTLLNNKRDVEQQQDEEEEDDEEVNGNGNEYGEDGNDEDNEDENEEVDLLAEYGDEAHEEEGEEEELDEDEDDGNSLNKDPFSMHFNQEEQIEKIVSEYQSKNPSLKLESTASLAHAELKYQRLHYGHSQLSKLIPDSDSASTLKEKLKKFNIRPKLHPQFQALDNEDHYFNDIDLSLIDSLFQYETTLYQYYTHSDLKSTYQDIYTLHILNHIMKTSHLILSNNEKKSKVSKLIESGQLNANDEPEFRDQGYYRPKVLLLLPTRNIAWQVVNKLIKNSGVLNVENKKKFQTQFYSDYKVNENTKNSKPLDFCELFDGNSNDFFTLGIKWSRNTMKLYCKLEHSDIIVASPLGLKMLLDKHNSDFLTSIEVCVIDKAEALLMQNWDHLHSILNKLNLPPKNFDGLEVDFSRIRMWSINDQAQYLTQFLCFTKYLTPELMSLIKRSRNLQNGSTLFKSIGDESGLTSLKKSFIKRGLINKSINLKQSYLRFNIDSIMNEPDKRFQFFKSVILPQILNKTSYQFGTLVYIPSYIDYLRVIDYLENETRVSFVAIDEYSSRSKLDRNRSLFMNKSPHARLMIYTERLHFFKRLDIKGVRNIIFYQLPTDPEFYQQVIEFLGNEKDRVDKNQRLNQLKGDDDLDFSDEGMDLNLCMIKVMFDKLDMMKLEKVVGSMNTKDLIRGVEENYELY